jgi:tetratricopeptide (TPR) repeat protein
MRKTLDNPEVGTLVLHRLGNVEGLTISATSSMAPKDAKKAFDKAQMAFKKQKWEDAQKELEKAVGEYPKYAVAWYQLGIIQERQGKLDLAKGSFREALKADGKFVSPYGNLANIALHEKKWQEAQDTSGQALRLNPLNFPQLWLFNAYANLQLHNLGAAETSAREGIKIDPNHNLVKLEQLLGLILASQGKYAEAADHVREYIARSPDATDLSLAQKQLREMEQRAAPASAANPTQ